MKLRQIMYLDTQYKIFIDNFRKFRNNGYKFRNKQEQTNHYRLLRRICFANGQRSLDHD